MPQNLTRSPSGLFRMAAWENEMERSHPRMPSWYWDEGQRRRHFIRWVEAEADSLALHLARLSRPDLDPPLAGSARTLIEALARDAQWARRLEEQAADRAA